MLDYMSFQTAAVQYAQRQDMVYLTTGSRELDALLSGNKQGGGGVETGSITEVYGEFRTGKTQFCHTCAPRRPPPPPTRRRRPPAAAPRAACLSVPPRVAQALRHVPAAARAGRLRGEGDVHRHRGHLPPRAPRRDRREVWAAATRPEGAAPGALHSSHPALPLYLRYGLNGQDVLDNVSYARAYNSDHQLQLLSIAACHMARCVRLGTRLGRRAPHTRAAPQLTSSRSARHRLRPRHRRQCDRAVPHRLLGARRARGAADAPRQVPARARPAGVAVRDSPRTTPRAAHRVATPPPLTPPLLPLLQVQWRGVRHHQPGGGETRRDVLGPQTAPIGGNIIAHASTTRLHFRKGAATRASA